MDNSDPYKSFNLTNCTSNRDCSWPILFASEIFPSSFTLNNTLEEASAVQQQHETNNTGIPFDLLITGIGSTIIAILGIFGNLLSAIILSRPQLRSSVSCLLLGLTFCDTCLITISIFIFSLPIISYHTGKLVVYYEIYYPLWVPYLFPISITAQTASVYLTLAVTLERFVAVLFPLKARSFCTSRRATNCVFFVILLAIIYNLPRWFEISTIESGTFLEINGRNLTTYLNEMRPMRNSPMYKLIYINWMYFLVMYLVPFAGLVTFNWMIYRQVRKANHERQSMSKFRRRELSLATMLLVVVVVFLLCNALPLVNNILESFYYIDIPNLIHLSNFFVILNSSVNFIIYCTCGERFRKHLVKFCKGQLINCNAFRRKRNRNNYINNSSLHRKPNMYRRCSPAGGNNNGTISNGAATRTIVTSNGNSNGSNNITSRDNDNVYEQMVIMAAVASTNKKNNNNYVSINQ